MENIFGMWGSGGIDSVDIDTMPYDDCDGSRYPRLLWLVFQR